MSDLHHIKFNLCWNLVIVQFIIEGITNASFFIVALASCMICEWMKMVLFYSFFTIALFIQSSQSKLWQQLSNFKFIAD